MARTPAMAMATVTALMEVNGSGIIIVRSRIHMGLKKSIFGKLSVVFNIYVFPEGYAVATKNQFLNNPNAW